MILADNCETFLASIGTRDLKPSTAKDQPDQVDHFGFIFNAEDFFGDIFDHRLQPEQIKFTTKVSRDWIAAPWLCSVRDHF